VLVVLPVLAILGMKATVLRRHDGHERQHDVRDVRSGADLDAGRRRTS
jgi:hypothetical protein